MINRLKQLYLVLMKNGDGCWQTVKGTKWYKCIITTDELMITNAVDE